MWRGKGRVERKGYKEGTGREEVGEKKGMGVGGMFLIIRPSPILHFGPFLSFLSDPKDELFSTFSMVKTSKLQSLFLRKLD